MGRKRRRQRKKKILSVEELQKVKSKYEGIDIPEPGRKVYTGKTYGLPIDLTMDYMFKLNAESPKSYRLTDAQLAAFMRDEFSNYKATSNRFATDKGLTRVNGYRTKFNIGMLNPDKDEDGTLTPTPPEEISHKYTGAGDIICTSRGYQSTMGMSEYLENRHGTFTASILSLYDGDEFAIPDEVKRDWMLLPLSIHPCMKHYIEKRENNIRKWTKSKRLKTPVSRRDMSYEENRKSMEMQIWWESVKLFWGNMTDIDMSKKLADAMVKEFVKRFPKTEESKVVGPHGTIVRKEVNSDC